MATKFLDSIDLAKTELLNSVLQNLASDPSSPVEGQQYFNSTSHTPQWFNGTTWISIATGSIGGSTGATDNAILRADGTGGSTVQASAITIADDGAMTFPDNVRQVFNPGADVAGFNAGSHAGDVGTPVNGDAWYNSATATMRGCYNGSVGNILITAGYLIIAAGKQPTLSNSVTIAGSDSATINVGADFVTSGGHAITLTTTGTTNVTLPTTGTVATLSNRLDQFAAPTASVSLNSQKITNLLDGTAAQDAATFGQMSALLQGLSPKPGATVATAAALPACTYANGTSGVGATLTGDANGALTVDTYAVAATDTVLVKNQSSGLQNGLYTVTQPGDGGTPFILTRHTSMDTTAEFPRASIVVEDAGSANANSYWVCTNSANPTVGTTAITFSQLNGATQLTAGNGIDISGNTILVNLTTASERATAGVTGKYSATIGDGAATSIAITQATHGLASTAQILVDVYDASTGAQVFPGISINNANGTVTFTFAAAPASNAYRVVLVG